MKIETLSVGPFEENCSIIYLDDGAWIVDPGLEATRIAARIVAAGATACGILLTHGHFDHIGAIPGLLERWPQLPVHIHEADAIMLGHSQNAFEPYYPQIPVPKTIVESKWPDFIDVIETPGHTRGGVSYYLKSEGVLFSGDTLFAGSAGRTDFPGGSYPQLIGSLKRLAALAPETRVIPGHGPETTIAREVATNPFLH